MSDRVELSRSGGFAGLRVHASAEADELSDAERAGMDVVREAGGAGAAATPGRPDRFVYELTVVTATAEHRMVVGEADLDDRLRPLVHRLEERAGPGR